MPAHKKPDHERKDYFTSFWCTEAQQTAWVACAEAEGVGLSTWIRNTLDYWAQQGYVPEVSQQLGVPTGRMIKRL